MDKEGLHQTDERICNAIRGCVSVGAGYVTEFSVNGTIVEDRVEWKQYAVIDPYYGGLICDNKLVVSIKLGDAWSAKEMTNYGTVLNSVDVSRIDTDVEELKRKTSKRRKVINI